MSGLAHSNTDIVFNEPLFLSFLEFADKVNLFSINKTFYKKLDTDFL